MADTQKYVYSFGGGSAEGRAEMKELLGGKGANLAEMSVIGIPVPPGFTLTTEVCAVYYDRDRRLPEELKPQVESALARMEEAVGKKFGEPADPLLVSVRSGAALSMPGMMNTILNLGLTDLSVEGLAKKTGNPRFAYDGYRRLIDMFGSTAMGVEHEAFEHELAGLKQERGVKLDTELDGDDLKELVRRYKAVYQKHVKEPFPQDPKQQLWKAIMAVFNSWMGNKAVEYRRIERISGLKGTAVNVQAMVFGNTGNDSGTGVAFTRDPNTGEDEFYGDYLINAQGEDVVAGIRTPEPISRLKEEMPKVYDQLLQIRKKLEGHYKEMQDIEFTVQSGTLYMLQTRTGKRTGSAAVRIAVEMVKEKLIDETTAIKRVSPDSLNHLLLPQLDPKAKRNAVARGIAASPGAACGKVVFSAEAAVEHHANHPGEPILLVRKETSPEDVAGMHLAKGILTATGGKASHAAVVARGWGKPCVVGCDAIQINEKAGTFTVGEHTVKAGDFVTIDGTLGDVMIGKVPTVDPSISGAFATFMSWADKVRTLKIRTNADTPEDSARARSFGAEGIGLCRTEHMFFGDQRIVAMRKMILADDEAGARPRSPSSSRFRSRISSASSRPWTDYPSRSGSLIRRCTSSSPATTTRAARLRSPASLGSPSKRSSAGSNNFTKRTRCSACAGAGCRSNSPRLAICRCGRLFRPRLRSRKRGKTVLPEIMIPLVGVLEELIILKKRAIAIAEQEFKKSGVTVEYQIGTMIEVPRAALAADQIAEEAEFFSFGTNDLTQLTFGFSRDDIVSFMPVYVEKKILPVDPFQTIDVKGVGQLIEIGVTQGRKSRQAKHGEHLKVGICGEHGGDPDSVAFCHNMGMDYVSCSPFRVPIARLAAAQAALAGGKGISRDK